MMMIKYDAPLGSRLPGEVVNDVVQNNRRNVAPSYSTRVPGCLFAATMSFMTGGCGPTIGGARLDADRLEAGRKATSNSLAPEPARGTPIKAGSFDVLAFACPSKKSNTQECAPLDDPTQRQLEMILRKTSDVITSPSFQSHVKADNEWFATPGASATIRGSALLEAYPAKLPTFVVELTASAAPGEAAATEIGPPPRIMIPKASIMAWTATALGPGDAGWPKNAALIDTFAHEMTHLLSIDEPPKQVMLDGGFSWHPCRMGGLVSYKIGHVAECVALGTTGAGFSACMTELHQTMYVPWYTYLWNWSRSFCERYPE